MFICPIDHLEFLDINVAESGLELGLSEWAYPCTRAGTEL